MADNRIYNFSAGPSMLPVPVLERCASEMLNYKGSGMSVMEMSHRSKVYDGIITETEAALHLILNPGQVIRKGEAHPNLFLAQAILAVLADTYSCVGNPGSSGVLDEATSDALAVFQMLSALPMTGHLDKETWKHLALQYPLAASRHVRKDALSDKDMDNP